MKVLDELAWITSFGYLGINSLWDLLYRKVLVHCSLLVGVAGIIYQVWKRELTWKNFVIGILLGVFVMILSRVTEGQIGMGDGIVILILGIWMGGRITGIACMISVMLAGIIAIYLMFIRKKNKEYEIPLVPFILVGLICSRLLY